MNSLKSDTEIKQAGRVYTFPFLLAILFFLVVVLPVDLLGCRIRGLMALSMALFGGLIGIASSVKAVIEKAKGRKDSHRYIITALIYALPACYIVFVAR